MFLTIFATNPFFETHLQTSILFALSMASSNGPHFLTINGTKYHPSLEWDKEEGLLQDPKTHAPHSKMDFKVSSFFHFFVGKFVGFMFCWELGVETLSFCRCFFLLKFWTLYDLVGNSCVVILALGHFWIVELFGMMKLGQCWWLMKFSNVCSLWHCWRNLDLNVVSIGIMRIWCVGLIEETHFWWVWKFCWNV